MLRDTQGKMRHACVNWDETQIPSLFGNMFATATKEIMFSPTSVCLSAALLKKLSTDFDKTWLEGCGPALGEEPVTLLVQIQIWH